MKRMEHGKKVVDWHRKRVSPAKLSLHGENLRPVTKGIDGNQSVIEKDHFKNLWCISSPTPIGR